MEKIFQTSNSAFSYLLCYSLIFSNIICYSDLCSAVRRIVLRLSGGRQYEGHQGPTCHSVLPGQNAGVGL